MKALEYLFKKGQEVRSSLSIEYIQSSHSSVAERIGKFKCLREKRPQQFIDTEIL